MVQPTCPECLRTLPAGSAGEHCPTCLAHTLFLMQDEKSDGSDEIESWGSIGGCDLHEELGRGGMGVVYRAKQRALNRIVAVKILRDSRFAGEAERARFKREALATGRMRHPGIVGVLDVGEEDGVPWLTMEYVDGTPLDRLPPMPPLQVAQCMTAVADAIQHAHEQGVLHRDIKPANILMDVTGQPRIADFGIAQFSSSESKLTRTGQSLGSPGYGAPEQILRGTADVRTDVYGIGATLYHLLTGRPPFTGQTTEAVLLDLRETNPVPPHRLNPSTPLDLETICLKCLQKQPASRYGTANEVASELRRFLAAEPIQARPIGPIGRLWSWARRHPGIAALVAVIMVLLNTVALSSVLFARRQAQNERRTALLAEARDLRTETLAGTPARMLQHLQQAYRLRPGDDIAAEAAGALSRHDIALIETLPSEHSRAQPPAHSGGSADSKVYLSQENSFLLVKNSADSILARIGPWPANTKAQLDDRGNRIAIAPGDAREVKIFQLPEATLLHTLPHPNKINCLAWSGELLAAGGSMDRMVHIWDASTGERLHRLSGHDAEIEALIFRRDGQELISAGRDSVIRVWHAGAGIELLRLEDQRQHTGPAWWAQDGEQLFLPATESQEIDVFRISWSVVQKILTPGRDEPRSENVPGSLSLTSDAKLATSVDERGARLWSIEKGRVLAMFPKDHGEWISAHIAPDSSSIWLASWNRGFQHIPLSTEHEGWPTHNTRQHSGKGSGPLLVAARADSKAFALTNANTVLINTWPPAPQLKLLHQGAYCAALSADGQYAVTGSYSESGGNLWKLPEGTLLRHIDHPGNVLGASFASGSLWLWGNAGITRLQVDTWQTAAPFYPQAIYAMAINSDGTLVAGTTRHDVVIHRATDMRITHRFPVSAAAGRIGSATLCFSADSSTLVLHAASGSLVSWKLSAVTNELAKLGMR